MFDDLRGQQHGMSVICHDNNPELKLKVVLDQTSCIALVGLQPLLVSFYPQETKNPGFVSIIGQSCPSDYNVLV